MKTKIQILVKSLMVMSLLTLFFSCSKTVKDADGNVYDVVKIGKQCWMKQNLKTSKYNDGSKIPTNLNEAEWLNDSIGAYTIYVGTDDHKDTIKNNKEYGKLYNWYAVKTGKLAPKGWHVATNKDYEILDDYLIHTEAGPKMRTVTGWLPAPNIKNTNSSGFSAKPGGCKNLGSGCSNDMLKSAYFWASSMDAYDSISGIRYPTCLLLENNGLNFDLNIRFYKPNFGMSVRCVKD